MMRTRHLAMLLAGIAACRPTDRPEALPAALTEIRSPAAAGSGEPNLTTGPDGRVYLTWIEPRPDSAHALRWAVLDGDAWTAGRTIAEGNPWFVNWADFPALPVFP